MRTLKTIFAALLVVGLPLFAFAADPTREVVVSNANQGVYFRIVDHDGRVVAAFGGGQPGKGQGPNNSLSIIRFRPDRRDVYYLVVNPTNAGTAFGSAATTPYSVRLSGMAPVTLGMVQSAGGAGRIDDSPSTGTDRFSVSLSSGSAGSIRVGTSVFSGTGGLQSTLNHLNTNTLDPALFFRLGRSTINIANTLFNIWTGADVVNPIISVGQHLGSFLSGLNPGAGTSTVNGDIIQMDLTVGGQI